MLARRGFPSDAADRRGHRDRGDARSGRRRQPHPRSFASTGIRVAIDDFGTGYSSLAYLEQFPIDYVKIDRRFVEQIEESDRSRSLVESMSRMVHSLGLTAVAEGVETARAGADVARDGIRVGAGLLLRPPGRSDELVASDRQDSSGDRRSTRRSTRRERCHRRLTRPRRIHPRTVCPRRAQGAL